MIICATTSEDKVGIMTTIGLQYSIRSQSKGLSSIWCFLRRGSHLLCVCVIPCGVTALLAECTQLEESEEKSKKIPPGCVRLSSKGWQMLSYLLLAFQRMREKSRLTRWDLRIIIKVCKQHIEVCFSEIKVFTFWWKFHWNAHIKC